MQMRRVLWAWSASEGEEGHIKEVPADSRQAGIPTKVFKVIRKNSSLPFVETCLWGGRTETAAVLSGAGQTADVGRSSLESYAWA